jgi:rod shape-determining protein MreC
VTERRIFLLLLVVVLGQLVLLTAQIPGPSGEGSTLDALALRVLAPPSRLIASAVDSLATVRRSLRSRSSLQGENRRLNEEIRRLRLEQARSYGLELQIEKLARALDYRPPAQGRVQPADVVYADHASFLRTLVIYLPLDGVSPFVPATSPVTSAGGLVGRLLDRQGEYARVQLITDRASSVGAMIARTRRQGIVRGGDGGLLVLDYVPLQADVHEGDRVVTAGIDGVYPQGIPVGVVVSVEPGSELFHRIRVLPAVDFGSLDQVYVLLRGVVPEELRGAGTSASR